ncbi:protein YgfX [Vibrio pelagius]|uniref:protein YgfX n=1 Tax=Vibrio pelagius TaxID=28169 RepID=UPI00354D6F26
MHTTSARFVKLKLSPSYYALFAKGATLWCFLVFIITSNIPLVATLYLFVLLYLLIRDNKIGWPIATGEIELRPNHEIIVNGEKRVFQSSDTIFRSLFVMLKFSEGEPVILWRDSCLEADYRYLLVWLKSKKGASCSL